MDRMLYLSMSGASQIMHEQSINAHNLANVSTPGFKADLGQARSMPVFGEGFATRVYAMTERPGADFDPGPIHSTGNELDIAVSGEGWIAVQAPDGGEAFTRAGDLRISSNGLLSTGAGHPVLGNGGPIAVSPAEKIELGADGTISLRPLGQAADTLVELDRIKLVNPPAADLEKGEDGLLRLRTGGVAPPDAGVRVVSGALEGSNVNAVEEMVRFISLARQFEMQIKMMNVAAENDAATSDMLSIS